VSSSIKIYQHFSIDRAYLGETFFWGLVPEQGDVVMIKFQPPIRIEK
jgi:alpha-1,3-mannosylglycoprotein beta-1,4-N-acetylglucosaminyltransferase A/B